MRKQVETEQINQNPNSILVKPIIHMSHWKSFNTHIHTTDSQTTGKKEASSNAKETRIFLSTYQKSANETDLYIYIYTHKNPQRDEQHKKYSGAE